MAGASKTAKQRKDLRLGKVPRNGKRVKGEIRAGRRSAGQRNVASPRKIKVLKISKKHCLAQSQHRQPPAKAMMKSGVPLLQAFRRSLPRPQQQSIVGCCFDIKAEVGDG